MIFRDVILSPSINFFIRVTGQLLAIVSLLFAAYFLWSDFPPQDIFVDDTKFGAEIASAAAKNGLAPDLVKALIYRESRFNPRAVGSAGECGLMQIMPSGAAKEWATANRVPVPSRAELFNVPLNLEIGCWYLARGMREYSGYRHKTELALARYNAGPRRTREWLPADKDGEVLPLIKLQSTHEYVAKIMARYKKYSAGGARGNSK